MLFFKKIIILLFALGIAISANAQFNLSGKILNYKGKELLKINIPLVFGFNSQNSTAIPIAKDGTFNLNLPIGTAKIANLIFQRKFYTLVLNPTKNLRLQLNEADSTLKVLAGTALAENKVMLAIEMEEYPFFLMNEGGKFAQLPLKELENQVLQPYFSQRDQKIALVNASSIDNKNKLLITSELTYMAYNYLNDLARTQITNKAVVDSLILKVFNQIDPKPIIFPAGPQYYAFVDNYIRFLETKAFVQMKLEKIPPTQAIPYFGISLDSANKVVKQYGKPYWRFIGVTKNLPANVAEQYSYQEIVNQYNNKDLKQTEGLVKPFTAQFPKSKHLIDINLKLATLQQMLVKNEVNANIKIITDYQKISSISEVIKPYKGKVIYLDIWGTWCGPCKEELRYVPDLKKRFAGKDVVFIYLDMDEDDQDSVWKAFIKVNSLSGIHLRKNRQSIAPFWKELLANATDKAEYYPQYFIFDKDGKLAVAKANRPSSKEELYQQITGFLK